MPRTAERNPLFGLKGRKMGNQAKAFRAALDEIAQTEGVVDGLAPGQRLFFWIGQAARHAREDAGLSLEAVAVELGEGKEKVDRFEKGRNRPRNIEEVLLAYAKVANIKDPRDIVANGVRDWYEHGEVPTSAQDVSDLPADEQIPPSA
jgi:transcriptional regulator with XRE-family HTH domain